LVPKLRSSPAWGEPRKPIHESMAPAIHHAGMPDPLELLIILRFAALHFDLAEVHRMG